MSHTPGPWTVKEIGEPFGHEIISQDGAIARTWWVRHPEGTPVPTMANSVLIAAAPDLLKALKALRAEVPPYSLGSPLLGMVDDAIAKAEGIPAKQI